MSKVIITAAITGGIHVPSLSPYLPCTPDEIAEEAVKANAAGASVVHIHARDPKTGKPNSDFNLFREIVSKISARCNVVICITTGGGLGMSMEELLRPISVLRPELASLNSGSINFAIYPLTVRCRFDYEFVASSAGS